MLASCASATIAAAVAPIVVIDALGASPRTAAVTVAAAAKSNDAIVGPLVMIVAVHVFN